MNELLSIHDFCGSPIKDFDGMELNRWQKLTRKSWTICMEMIANANLNANSNVLAVSSNVLVDGMKISR